MVSVKTKVCSQCKKKKALQQFYKDRSKSSGYRYACKTCEKLNIRKHYNKKYTCNNLKRIYINGKVVRKVKYTKEEQVIVDLLRKSKTCMACGCKEPINNRSLSIDHDHDTGRIRGILCSSCNRALGLLKEDIVNVANLWNYLRTPFLK